MRQVDPQVLLERKNKVLQAVIHHFIKTGRPVASSILTDDYSFDLSPATIRNLMAELEEEGFLTHPHTSAGRIPTDKGYRNYVDSLIELQKLVVDEEDRIRKEYDNRIKELHELLIHTSKILSGLSQYSGFILTSKQERNQLQYLELINVSEGKILVIMVTQTGMVKHRLIEARIQQEKLNELNSLLNKKLRGLTIGEVKNRIENDIREFERQEKEILNLARILIHDVFDVEDEIYLDGTNNVLTLPEFHDYEPMRCLLRLKDEKDLLIQLLNENLDQNGVNVIIGSESSCKELKDLSVISTVYKNKDEPVGLLGIIGPKRMEYERMMAIVSAVSNMVNKILSRLGG